MNEVQSTESVITISDLQNMLVFIDLATQRGALRGQELAGVGALYEKINRFVQGSQQTQTTDEKVI